METFRINDKIKVVCEYKSTRSGFKHTAKLYVHDFYETEVKVCYQNRTWERFEYDTVLQRLAEKTKRPEIAEFVENRTSDSGTDWLNTISMVAKMAGVLSNSTEEANKVKQNILKAGLGENVNFPDNFDSLSEDEKKNRLDGAIDILSK